MSLRLTPKTAELIGETVIEWKLLEKQAHCGRWTSGPRADADRLRALAAELGVVVREEGVVPWRRRPHVPHRTGQTR